MEEKNGKLSVIAAPEKNAHGSEKASFWHIDKEMLPFKIHFFLFVGGMGATLPYVSAVGITRFNLTASNIAAAFTAQQFLFLVLKPCIGYLADYFNQLKAMIIGLTVIQAIFSLFIILIPTVEQESCISQYNWTLRDHFQLHMCNHSEEIKFISLSKPLPESAWNQVFACLKFSENDIREYTAVHCSNESLNSFYSADVNYQVVRRSCEYHLKDDILYTEYKSNSVNLTDVLLISQSFDNSRNSSIVCLLPKDEMLFLTNLFFNNIKKYCYSIPESDFANADELLLSTPPKTTDSILNSSACTNHQSDTNLSARNFRSYQFWVYAVCVFCSFICISCLFTMSDTACYESVQGKDYGRQRAWGAVSWGIVAPFAGFLNDYTGNYLISWCLMALFCSLLIWNLSKMSLVKPDFSQSIFKDIKTVFSSFEFAAFEIGALLNGMATGMVWHYLTWFVLSIGGNKLTVGLVHTMQCFFGELPFMFFSGWFIKKLGHFNIVTLALLFHGIRFFIYSYIHNPWYMLPVESFHGVTFGAFYSALTSYGKLSSKPGTEATTQSILCVTYECLGAGLGCVFSGICFELYGGHTTFFYASFLCIIATTINVVFSIIIGYRKGKLNVTKKVGIHDDRY